jgi:hypothetical protein
MNDVPLRAEHAIELVELLEFLQDWTATDHETINQSLTRFAPGYDVHALHADLARFAFLLGANSDPLLPGPEEPEHTP